MTRSKFLQWLQVARFNVARQAGLQGTSIPPHARRRHAVRCQMCSAPDQTHGTRYTSSWCKRPGWDTRHAKGSVLQCSDPCSRPLQHPQKLHRQAALAFQTHVQQAPLPRSLTTTTTLTCCSIIVPCNAPTWPLTLLQKPQGAAPCQARPCQCAPASLRHSRHSRARLCG